MKAIFVFRKLTSRNGTALLHPIGIAADETVAKDMVAHAEGFVKDISQGRLVVNTTEGPRQVMSVSQLFAELGIASVDTVTMTAEAKETSLVVPRNLVALQ